MFRQKIAASAAAANATSDEYGDVGDATKQGEEDLRKMAEDILSTCDGLGGTLGAIASVLRACLTNEFLKAKYVSIFPPYRSLQALTYDLFPFVYF